MGISSAVPSIQESDSSGSPDRRPAIAWLPVLAVAGAVTLLHILTNGRYGFHRDELQFLSDARHMDWGFVAYPPMTPFLERIALSIFGLSLVGLRLFSVISQAIALVVTALMARELGGGRLAQATAALTVALSPLPLFEGTEFQYSSFDYLWWVLIAYFIVRLLNTENPRWWLAIGGAIGLGLLTKYSIVFYIAGILAGMILSPARRYFRSGWFWTGVALALLIFLPNLLWLVRHDFISYHFLQHIHARDVGEGRANSFLFDQVKICINLVAAPLAIAGLVGFFRERRYRMLAWMYAVPLGAFFLARGRGYYLAGAYPMLLAMGAVALEQWAGFARGISTPETSIGREENAMALPRRSRLVQRIVAALFFFCLIALGALFGAIVIPFQSNGPLRDFALKNNEDLREEIGWNELVQTVAGIRNSLTPDEQAHLGITTGNYGEYGAIEMLGPAYGLPAPIGTTNSEWLRGYPTPQPTTLIVIGLGREEADSIFIGCRWAGHNGNSEGVRNEESRDHPDIFVCGPPRQPWPELWKEHKDFG